VGVPNFRSTVSNACNIIFGFKHVQHARALSLGRSADLFGLLCCLEVGQAYVLLARRYFDMSHSARIEFPTQNISSIRCGA